MNPQLTRLDVVTTEDGYLLVLNQVMEMVKVVNEATGMRQLLTKREALLVCMGFKTGEAYVCDKYGINE